MVNNRIGATAKGLPHGAIGATISEFLSASPRIEDFWTPLVTLDEDSLEHNIGLLSDWALERGLHLMPHGKTTMAPSLWKRQLAAGAKGISLATLGQARVAIDAGIKTVHIANEAVDPAGLSWLASQLGASDLEVTCWVDSIEGAQLMETHLARGGAPRKLPVLVELGVAGKRSGVRTLDEGRKVAEYVAQSSWLRLGGVAGYEGVVGDTRDKDVVRGVEEFLDNLLSLHGQVKDLYDGKPAIVSAGGSAYFDLVAEAFARGGVIGDDMTTGVIRSGAYLTHDEGHYKGLSPLDEVFVTNALRPALTGYARVVSSPEPGLVIVDAGRRDLPYDLDLPFLHGVGESLAGPFTPIKGHVEKLNDQHAFVRIDGDNPQVGSVLSFGISHPCTTFDKWSYLPIVNKSGTVVDLVQTYF